MIVQPSGFCGTCRYCRMGLHLHCPQSFATGDGPEDVCPGSFAKYTVTSATSVYLKPKHIRFDAACQTEPVRGAWKDVMHTSQMQLGDDVVVIGTGGTGMYCLMVAKAAGAGQPIAMDISDYALETARRLGAMHTVNSRARTRKPPCMTSCPMFLT